MSELCSFALKYSGILLVVFCSDASLLLNALRFLVDWVLISPSIAIGSGTSEKADAPSTASYHLLSFIDSVSPLPLIVPLSTIIKVLGSSLFTPRSVFSSPIISSCRLLSVTGTNSSSFKPAVYGVNSSQALQLILEGICIDFFLTSILRCQFAGYYPSIYLSVREPV